MGIKQLALILMVMRTIVLLFTGSVFVKQLRLTKKSLASNLLFYRKVLLFLSVNVIIASVICFAIDLLTVLSTVHRSTNHVNPIGLIYTLANDIPLVLLSIAFWVLYKIAAQVLIHVEEDKAEALSRK